MAWLEIGKLQLACPPLPVSSVVWSSLTKAVHAGIPNPVSDNGSGPIEDVVVLKPSRAGNAR